MNAINEINRLIAESALEDYSYKSEEIKKGNKEYWVYRNYPLYERACIQNYITDIFYQPETYNLLIEIFNLTLKPYIFPKELMLEDALYIHNLYYVRQTKEIYKFLSMEECREKKYYFGGNIKPKPRDFVHLNDLLSNEFLNLVFTQNSSCNKIIRAKYI